MMLSGIKILDLTSVVVGPAATLRLAEFGADIIKIESPDGDLMRTLGGPSPSGDMSGKFLHFNRNKRFVCLNLRTLEGREAIWRILETCDAVITNIRPDALNRLGLDAAHCRKRHPSLVHCTITGFGPEGPYRGRPAYDTVLQAASGLAGLTIVRDGVPNFIPLVAVDHIVGEITAGTVSAALVGKFQTGKGASIEVPMLETMAAFVLKEHLGPATFQPPLGPAGDRRVLDPNARPVATRDGWIAISANTDVQARAFLKAVGRPELIDDERFSSVAARVRYAGDWFALREEVLANKSTDQWLKIFGPIDVPAMKCHSLDTMLEDEHLKSVGLVQDAVHPTEGGIYSVRSTVLFDGKPTADRNLARALGADTRSVLKETGYSDEEIDVLIDSGSAVE